MRVPDMRPIEVLTPEILATASHWAFKTCDGLRVAKTRSVGLYANANDAGVLQQWVSLWVTTGIYPSATCCPCTLHDDGRVEFEPWPMLPGEEEIAEWFDKYGDPAPYYEAGMGWRLYDEDDETWTSAFVPARTGVHPALRQDRCWVWEADKK